MLKIANKKLKYDLRHKLMTGGTPKTGGDIMSIINIATDWNQGHVFEENPTGQNINLKRRSNMGIQKKFWILAASYLISLWVIWLLTLVVMAKIL